MRVVMLGAGYGGIRLAIELERGLHRGHWKGQIVLVDQFPLHQLVTELHQVAAGSVLSDFAAIPLAKVLGGKRIAFRQATVTGFDFPGHRVQTTEGDLIYDVLALGLGGEVDYFDVPTPRIPGLREHAAGIQTMQQANTVQFRLQEAVYRYSREAAKGAKPLTLVIGGGGMTGVEMAGQLADEAVAWRDEYGLAADGIQIQLIEAQERLLPGLHPQIASYAASVLQRKGVTVRLRTAISRVERGQADEPGATIRLVLASGEEIRAGLLIWAGGMRGPSLLAGSGLSLDPKGRVIVNGYLQAQGHTHVYALGDCALVLHPHTGLPCAPSARLALHEAYWLARYLTQQWTLPFMPHTTGVVISLGPGAAVAVIGRLQFFGRLASWLKSLITMRYLYSLGGLRLLIYQLRIGVLGKI
jgi:NADH dehydrogenase